MAGHIVVAFLMWCAIAVIRLAFIVVGLFVVPLALPFAREHESDRNPAWESWRLIRLPAWAWPWDNLRDGAMGDVRGWYWFEGYPAIFDRLPESWQEFVKAWYWLGIRNPANNISRYARFVGCNVDHARVFLLAGREYVRDDSGGEGWQFVTAEGRVFRYYGFYWVSRSRVFGRMPVIRLGHKIEPRHNDVYWGDAPQKAWKGVTFRVSFKR